MITWLWDRRLLGIVNGLWMAGVLWLLIWRLL